jgi:hypothetical protein
MKAKEPKRSKVCCESWARDEMAQLGGCEKRLRSRVICLLEDCAGKPGASLPRACGNWTRSKAAYRCLSNSTVEARALLRSHTQATWERMRSHEVVLAVADTTSLNHTTHPCTKGLGPIHTKGSSARGMHLHSVLALSEQGEPLGLLHAHEWVRAKVRGRKESKRDHNSRAPQDKESARWLAGYEELVRQGQQAHEAKARLIMVGDREADIYELFLAAQKSKEACGLLVRAVHPRRLQEQKCVVWEHLREQPESGRLSVEVPAQGSRPARIATLSVRSAAVKLSVPVDKQYHFGASEPLEVWAIEAVELQVPDGQQPLHWKLLGSEAAETFAQASRQLKWYAKRWSIEVFHKTLKSGCRTEDRQLGTHEGLVRMLMVDAIVAWHLMAVTYAARHQPDAPASQWLEDTQWRVLSCWATKRPPPAQPPSIQQAVTWIARLGGFLARRSDGSPGVQSLWLGLLRLHPMVELWNAQPLVGNG